MPTGLKPSPNWYPTKVDREMHIFDNMLTFEWRLFYTCVATFIINLPFGYLRGGLRKLSFWWLVAIHAPVPLVIIIRKFHDLELSWILAPFLLGSFFLGQFAGRKIYGWKPFRKGKQDFGFPKPKI